MKNNATYQMCLQKEAEFWGRMAEERWKGGIPLTMDYQRATRYRVRREALGWGDYIQDPVLEALTPFGTARTQFIEFAKSSKANKALDLCCGAGFLSLELARAGISVDAIDCSQREINVAKKYQSKLRQKPPGRINWIVADLNHYELPARKYDLVTVWDGLHHIPDIERLCNKIRNSLKPGGKFLFCERTHGGNAQSLRTNVSRALEVIVNSCLPLAWSYAKRANALKAMIAAFYRTYLLKRPAQLDIDVNDDGCDTPFEDSTGNEMLQTIKDLFEIDKIQRFGAFSEEACRSLNLPRVLRAPAILLLSWFDYFWVLTALLEGKLLMGYAHKQR